MTARAPIFVTFHPDAAARFNKVAQEILQSVESFGPIPRSSFIQSSKSPLPT